MKATSRTTITVLICINFCPSARSFYVFTPFLFIHKPIRSFIIQSIKSRQSDDLQMFFDSLVDLTEPILQEIDAEKASMSVFGTTGLEAYVTENNPKYANQKIRQLKSWAKTKGFDNTYKTCLIKNNSKNSLLALFLHTLGSHALKVNYLVLDSIRVHIFCNDN